MVKPSGSLGSIWLNHWIGRRSCAEPKSIFPEATEDNCPALPRVIPVGVTNIDDVHAIENVTLEPVNDHFDDMFQGNSAWQKGFSLEDQVI